MISLCVFLMFSLVLSSKGTESTDTESKTVNILQGLVRGYKSAKWNLYEFYGIPYATPPKGEDKFKAPLSPPEWTNTFDAVKNNIVCPQNIEFMEKYEHDADYYETENCLVANILVSNTNDINKPVLVYVHGGAYQIGYGTSLEPKTLVEEGNIIAVTFNYRLSVEGFLCLGTEKIPGNAGIKDMIALLNWVKENIASFGGNPNDVTIAGYSAGSSAVDLLMLSDVTTGLFHKVIPESGVGNAVWSVQIDPLENAIKLAKSLNFFSSNITDLEHFFITASYETLTANPFREEKDSTFQFVPCVERDFGQERFLKDSPLNILKNRKFKQLPTLIGHTSAEGYLRGDVFETWKDNMHHNFTEFLPADLQILNDDVDKVSQTIREFYFGDKAISGETVEEYLNYFGDVFFDYAIIKNVMKQVEAGNENVYYYIYSFFDNTTVMPYMLSNQSLPINAAYHCAQSYAIYDIPAVESSAKESKDYKEMRQMLRQIWINFIRTGKPILNDSAMFPDGWPPASKDATPYMVLDVISQLSYEMNSDLVMFWDEIYAKYYRHPIPPPHR